MRRIYIRPRCFEESRSPRFYLPTVSAAVFLCDACFNSPTTLSIVFGLNFSSPRFYACCTARHARKVRFPSITISGLIYIYLLGIIALSTDPQNKFALLTAIRFISLCASTANFAFNATRSLANLKSKSYNVLVALPPLFSTSYTNANIPYCQTFASPTLYSQRLLRQT
ncbi:hypothetical protein F4604DRAFT_1796013 [Suillus subluteus]|nr:hypothetical protein F4604DRAFT_1796013 [Suillus subluteus]